MRDFYKMPIWFLVTGKKAITEERGMVLHGYRHSQHPTDGGVKMARFGGSQFIKDRRGLLRKLVIHPWGERDAMETFAIQAKENRGKDYHVATSFSGDEETNCLHDVACIDFDYHADLDPHGMGADWRIKSLASMLSRGCPAWKSGGGEGYHVLFRVHQDDFKRWRPTKEIYPKPVKGGKAGPRPMSNINGCHFEVFTPSAKGLVVLQVNDPISPDYWRKAGIPTLRFDEIWKLMKSHPGLDEQSSGSAGNLVA